MMKLATRFKPSDQQPSIQKMVVTSGARLKTISAAVVWIAAGSFTAAPASV